MMSKSLRMTSPMPMCVFFTAIAVVALVSAALGAIVQSDVALHSRQKRSVLQMCRMVRTYADRSCLDYNAYGCFCGEGRGGNTPVDDVDKCCQEHTECWSRTGCWRPEFLLVWYRYSCISDACSCTDSPINSCNLNTCRCDLDFAKCVGNATYNPQYFKYDRSLCKETKEVINSTHLERNLEDEVGIVGKKRESGNGKWRMR